MLIWRKGRCGVFAGNSVWSTSERLVVEVLTMDAIQVHFLSFSTPLAESSGADWVQAGRSYIKMHLQNSTDVSGWWTPPTHRSRDKNLLMIGTDHTTVSPPYTAVDCRRPSFSCRRCPHLRLPAVPRHIRIISACFKAVWKRTSSGVLYRNCCSVSAKWLCHYWHSNRSIYLLTTTGHRLPFTPRSFWLIWTFD